MGKSTFLKCPKCGFSIEFRCGVGFLFEKENDKILSDMKNGRLGKRFQFLSIKANNPRVEHSWEMFKCTKCGGLKNAQRIRLYDGCELITEKGHRCSSCHGKMELVDDINSIVCPHCKSALQDSGIRLMWD